MVKGTYTIPCFTSWENAEDRGCPSRAKDKAQVSFLVTEEWKEIKWNCTLGGIMFLVICLSTNVAFLIIIRENQTWFHSRGRETLTAWNVRSPPSLHCHLFLSCHLDVMSTQYKKVYKNTRKSYSEYYNLLNIWNYICICLYLIWNKPIFFCWWSVYLGKIWLV